MGNKRMAGLWVLILGLLLGIWNMDTPAFSGIAIFGNILTIGISILMPYKCKRSDIMADLHAAIVGSSWGVLLGISLTAGVCKLFNRRSVHPYDEAAFGIICVVSLLLVLIIGWIDGIANAERRSFRRFLLQGCIRLLNIGQFPVFLTFLGILVAEVCIALFVHPQDRQGQGCPAGDHGCHLPGVKMPARRPV